MKEAFLIIKEMDLVFKFTLTLIFILVIFIRIKSMVKESSSGLVCLKFHVQKIHKSSFSIIKEVGGVDFLMEKVNIIDQMVKIKINLGDIYVG